MSEQQQMQGAESASQCMGMYLHVARAEEDEEPRRLLIEIQNSDEVMKRLERFSSAHMARG